jgi:hypothetical protein
VAGEQVAQESAGGEQERGTRGQSRHWSILRNLAGFVCNYLS